MIERARGLPASLRKRRRAAAGNMHGNRATARRRATSIQGHRDVPAQASQDQRELHHLDTAATRARRPHRPGCRVRGLLAKGQETLARLPCHRFSRRQVLLARHAILAARVPERHGRPGLAPGAVHLLLVFHDAHARPRPAPVRRPAGTSRVVYDVIYGHGRVFIGMRSYPDRL